jgi:pimeloyl-ACP methyl ester carboxylesterase
MAGAGTLAYTDEIVDRRTRAIEVPTLILFGEHDKVVPPGNANLMAQKIANATINIIPGAGHIFPIEDPQATVQAIVEFLRET